MKCSKTQKQLQKPNRQREEKDAFVFLDKTHPTLHPRNSAEYNPMHNSIDINHYNGYILWIDCNQAESGIRTTPNSQWCLNALAIDNPPEYAILALDGDMQAWVNAEDSLEVL